MKTKYVITFHSQCYDIDGGRRSFWVEYAGDRQKEALRMLTRVFERTIREEQKGYPDYKLSRCPDFMVDQYKINDKNKIVKRITFSLIGHWVDKSYYIIDLIEIPADSEIDEMLFMDNPEKITPFCLEKINPSRTSRTNSTNEIIRFFEPFYAIIKAKYFGEEQLVLINPSSYFYPNVVAFELGYTSKEAEIIGETTVINQKNLGALYPHSYRILCSVASLENEGVRYGYYDYESRTICSTDKAQLERCRQGKEYLLQEIHKRGTRIDHYGQRFPETLLYDAEYLLQRPGKWIDTGISSLSDLHLFIDKLLNNTFSKAITGSMEQGKILVCYDWKRSNDKQFRDKWGLTLMSERDTTTYLFIKKDKGQFRLKIEGLFKCQKPYMKKYVDHLSETAANKE